MRIGDIELNPGALLAPMEAVTDLPFRTVCEELGAALTFTEFLSAEALTRGAAKAIGRMWPSLGGRRFAVQIFGREPEALARAADMAVEVGASIVDINMGCPAKKVTAGACGSALMREPALAAELVAAVRARGPGAHPGHRQAPRRLGRQLAQRGRVRARAGRRGRRDDHRARPHARAGILGAGAHGADRRRCARRCRATIPVVGNGDVKDVAAYDG